MSDRPLILRVRKCAWRKQSFQQRNCTVGLLSVTLRWKVLCRLQLIIRRGTPVISFTWIVFIFANVYADAESARKYCNACVYWRLNRISKTYNGRRRNSTRRASGFMKRIARGLLEKCDLCWTAMRSSVESRAGKRYAIAYAFANGCGVNFFKSLTSAIAHSFPSV